MKLTAAVRFMATRSYLYCATRRPCESSQTTPRLSITSVPGAGTLLARISPKAAYRPSVEHGGRLRSAMVTKRLHTLTELFVIDRWLLACLRSRGALDCRLFRTVRMVLRELILRGARTDPYLRATRNHDQENGGQRAFHPKYSSTLYPADDRLAEQLDGFQDIFLLEPRCPIKTQ